MLWQSFEKAVMQTVDVLKDWSLLLAWYKHLDILTIIFPIKTF